MASKQGHLVIIGGAEDKLPDPTILTRVVALAGGPEARILILLVGSKLKADKLDALEDAYRAQGPASVGSCRVETREEADAVPCLAAITDATCLVLTGSDPNKLVSVLRGTMSEQLIHKAFERQGTVVVATGGAASAISQHKVSEGTSDIHPRGGLISLKPGLGFLDRIVIDHHFSERQRMGRLLAIVAQTPTLLGVGIDGQTALVVAPGRSLEVVGQATVTILDGRAMSYSNVHDIPKGEIMAMGNVQLHLLPNGFGFDLKSGLTDVGRGGEKQRVPPALQEMVGQMVTAQPYKAPAKTSP